MDKKLLRLYAITDRAWLGSRTLEEDVERALKGGVTLVQLREKHMSTEELIASAAKIKAVCVRYGVPLIINDNVDAAIASGADGVHLGQSDMSVAKAREMLGNDKIIGATAKTVEQALRAQDEGADYLGSGAIFGTTTKGDAKKMELSTLKSITAAVTIPVVAIGGITAGNVSGLRGTGIAGAAVVSGIFAEADIEAAARNLYERIGEII